MEYSKVEGKRLILLILNQKVLDKWMLAPPKVSTMLNAHSTEPS